MISVNEALDHLFSLSQTLPTETVPLLQAYDRVLRADCVSTRNQPPFPASAMDGYAVVSAETGDTLTVIGESAAGHAFGGSVASGQAVRIFTGAPVPEGATRIVIQEDVDRNGDQITIKPDADTKSYIRPAGNDFAEGFALKAPMRITPNDLALMASMNCPEVTVSKRPKVALISTGDELVMPGETPGPDQIIASNTFGLHAMLSKAGADVRLLPIARDTINSLQTVLGFVEDADLVITIGGTSVGDHDLVAQAAEGLGLERSFYKVAMRPGKPLMAGRLNNAMMVGLPGNPVSAMVCGRIFVVPLLHAMMGLPAAPVERQKGLLLNDIGQNGPREHYMRAHLTAEGLDVADRQDSALLSVLSASNALAVRAPHDPARKAGDVIEFITI